MNIEHLEIIQSAAFKISYGQADTLGQAGVTDEMLPAFKTAALSSLEKAIARGTNPDQIRGITNSVNTASVNGALTRQDASNLTVIVGRIALDEMQ